MKNQNKIKLFEDKKVRTLWNEGEEQWYFSIVDVIEVLTESIDVNAYWRKLKQRLKEEGNETVTNCNALNSLEQNQIMSPWRFSNKLLDNLLIRPSFSKTTHIFSS